MKKKNSTAKRPPLTWKINAQRSLVEKCKIFLLTIEATLAMKYAVSVTFFKVGLNRFFRVIGGHFKRESSFFVSFYVTVYFYVALVNSFGIYFFKIFGVFSISLTLNPNILFLNVYDIVNSKFYVKFKLPQCSAWSAKLKRDLRYRKIWHFLVLTTLSLLVWSCKLPLEKFLVFDDEFDELNSF